MVSSRPVLRQAVVPDPEFLASCIDESVVEFRQLVR